MGPVSVEAVSTLMAPSVWLFLIMLSLVHVTWRAVTAFTQYYRRCVWVMELPGLPPTNPLFGHVLEVRNSTNNRQMDLTQLSIRKQLLPSI